MTGPMRVIARLQSMDDDGQVLAEHELTLVEGEAYIVDDDASGRRLILRFAVADDPDRRNGYEPD